MRCTCVCVCVEEDGAVRPISLLLDPSLTGGVSLSVGARADFLFPALQHCSSSISCTHAHAHEDGDELAAAQNKKKPLSSHFVAFSVCDLLSGSKVFSLSASL